MMDGELLPPTLLKRKAVVYVRHPHRHTADLQLDAAALTTRLLLGRHRQPC